MTDAYENENLPQEGQPVDNVGQDEGQATGESSNANWEEQAKYFQSEKDKLASENQNLKKYEAIGNLLQQRPDIANTITAMVQGGSGQPVGPQRIELEKEKKTFEKEFEKTRNLNRISSDSKNCKIALVTQYKKGWQEL